MQSGGSRCGVGGVHDGVRMRGCGNLDPASTIEAFGPVAGVHAFHAHSLAFAGCVDEFAISHINADVAECTAHGVEEHQITGLEFLLINFLCGFGLLAGLAGQKVADCIMVDGADKAAAVKTCLRAGAAKAVGNANHAHGSGDERGSAGGHRMTHRLQMRAQATLMQDFSQSFLCEGDSFIFLVGGGMDTAAGQGNN